MNFLRLLSDGRKRYRRNYAQYWLDQLVDRMRVENPHVGIAVTGQVIAILRNELLGAELIVPGVNIVTNDGDLYYAQSICAESPTDDFDGAASGLRLGDDNTAPGKTDADVTNFLATSAHALDAGYEKTSDADADNTGAGADIVTWRYSYLTSEGNVAGIIEGAIVDDRTTPTAALTHFLFGGVFTKTSSDTLKVFVNHEVLGV
jgi:hypothetical protein